MKVSRCKLMSATILDTTLGLQFSRWCDYRTPVHLCRGFRVAPVVRTVTDPTSAPGPHRTTGLEVPRADHVARPGGGRNGVIGGVGRRRGPDHIAGTTSRA